MRVPPGRWDDEIRHAETFANSIVHAEGELRVLEAGCGAKSFLAFRDPTYVVGVDVSAAEVARHPRLDERKVGDLQTDDLGAGEFHAAICWYVLEHVAAPEAALSNIRRALKEGGLLVLAVPNVSSLKGAITRITPHRFHRWVYRRVFRYPEEHQPFPTIFAPVLRPAVLIAYAESRGWRVEYVHQYEGWAQKSLRYRFGIVGWRWRLLSGLIRLVSAGRLDAEKTELIVILRKFGGSEERRIMGRQRD